MGLFDRLFRRAETRAAPVSDPSWAALSNGGALAYASPREAEAVLAAVAACVQVTAAALASMPWRVYQSDGRGRREQEDHDVARLLRRPNDIATGTSLREWWLGQTLLHGNGVLAVEFDGAGRPVGLRPIPWPQCAPVALQSGRVAIDATMPSGERRRLFADEILWLRDRTDDGVVGRSRISRCAEVIAAAMALQRFAGSYWERSAMPSGLYSVKGTLDEKQYQLLKTWLEQNHAGPRHAHAPMLLDREAEFHPTSADPETAQMLASRQFVTEEVCRVFGVPPPLVADYSRNTFTNSGAATLWFATHSLKPWAAKIESEFARVLFANPEFHLEVDLSDLLRGDHETRWRTNVAAVQAGILDADEVRELEGWSPRGAKTEAGVG